MFQNPGSKSSMSNSLQSFFITAHLLAKGFWQLQFMCIKSPTFMLNLIDGCGISNCVETLQMDFLGILVYATRTDSISSDFCGQPAPFLCSTRPVSINFLCHDRMVGLADSSLPYLCLKFYWDGISDFISINQDMHQAFTCGVFIFINCTFAAEFKKFCLNPK